MNATHTIDHTLIFIHWLLIHFMLLTLTIMTQPLKQNLEAVAGGAFKNFVTFTGKHLCWRLFFTKLQVLRSATLLKETLTQVFSSEIWEILKNTFFKEPLWTTASLYWLLHHKLIFRIHYSARFCTFTNNFFFITQLKQ